MATHDRLPLRCITNDIEQFSFIKLTSLATTDHVHTSTLPPSKVFKDNNFCIVLATTDMQFKPHTKHISIKYHHFHHQVHDGTLEIINVGTDKIITDIFTKPLARHKFQHLQHLLSGR
jgi:hypothetical protein